MRCISQGVDQDEQEKSSGRQVEIQKGGGRRVKGARTKRDGEQDKKMSGRTCMKRKKKLKTRRKRHAQARVRRGVQ
jgi:hypothetical protein